MTVGKTPADIDHLSHSSISTFLRCPRQWAYGYLEGLRQPPGIALLKGKAVDVAASDNLNHKRVTKTMLPLDEVLERAEDALRADVDRNGGASEIDWGGENFARALDSTIGLTELHMTKHAPVIRPAEVQLELRRPLPGGREFLGYLDFVEEDGTVGDIKTGSRAMPQADADDDQQATAYAYLMGRDIAFNYWRVIDTGRNRKEEVVSTSRTTQQAAWFETAAAEVSNAIDAGVFPPNTNGWHCSPRFCGYYERCRKHNCLPQIG